MRLAGKVALVTGAGQGVGRGIAMALAREGVAIAAIGRTMSKLEDCCAEIEAIGGKAIAIQCDILSETDLEQSVNRTVERFGRLDILVNNAQEAPFGPLIAMSDETFLRTYGSGPLASFRFMKQCYPHLKNSKGVVFNFTSAMAASWTPKNFSIYASAKSAVETLSRAAAVEWGRDGIRVLVIAPHADSPGVRDFGEREPAAAAAVIKNIPMGRIGECERDIGRAVAALCTDDFGYMTGTIIPLDGGQANFN